jgi:hypothetical protein
MDDKCGPIRASPVSSPLNIGEQVLMILCRISERSLDGIRLAQLLA